MSHHQELLQEAAESFLRCIVSEVCDSFNVDCDSFASFGEMGVDSFHVLKIIKRLEADFGNLPKSLLFESFNIHDLASYFIDKHKQIIVAKCTGKSERNELYAQPNAHKPAAKLFEGVEPAANRANGNGRKAEPIRILEKEVSKHPVLQQIVQPLFERHKLEGCVSRGTRKIAPNLFIGSAKHGYFNYGRTGNILLVYGYTGPRDYLPVLTEEMYRYCEAKRFQLNLLADDEVPPIGNTSFSATPFGVLQRISNLKEFTLEGGAMRRLRYQVARFEKSGVSETREYQCGSNPEIDKNIVGIIDRWCAERSMVNPLVHDVKTEILAGKLNCQHRLFLTYLDDVLQNVILITAMSVEENGYLMDLEFYPPDMPMGGLEFAITQIIKVLATEGCDVLSLGGTYGCKLSSSANADPGVDKVLDQLREQNIFNDAGNLQFKNKFRPDNKTIFVCRPVGSDDPDNVIDIIMMIADPERMQTSDEENHNYKIAPHVVAEEPSKPRRSTNSSYTRAGRAAIEGNERSRILSEFGFNPLNIPYQFVEFDLKTDSWAQLEMASIEAHLSHMHAHLQQPANVDDSLKGIFPFTHFILTGSGQEAEHLFFKMWPKKGVVLQNLLFPSTIFHQIDKGFISKELPHSAIFDLKSRERYKGNMDWQAMQTQVTQDPNTISFVCIELCNNAAGGQAVSMQHIEDVKTFLTKHSIPLVIDCTRVVENARLLVDHEEEYADRSIWAVVREILSNADAVIGSLTKDFCVKKGGIIATNDLRLFHRLQECMHDEGTGVDLIDRKMIALSLQNRKQIESKVLRRIDGVRMIWEALNRHNVPIVHPSGGHCILIDVKQIPEFKDFKYPVASFLAWMYLNSGIRASAHSVGMQKHTSINDLVRLAIPIGLTRDQIESLTQRLLQAFDKKENIPEIVMESELPQPLGGIHANYKLIEYHNLSEGTATRTDFTIVPSTKYVPGANSPAADPLHLSVECVQSASASETIVAKDRFNAPASSQADANTRRSHAQEIAIVGMAGRYPKAKNPRELWENLVQGRDCIEDIPAERYEERLRHGSFERYRGGFMDDVDKFDSLFFNISPREAEMLDPQERLFLEVAWEAIEDAGYYPESLAAEDGSRNIGVFVGAVWAMYQMLGVEEKYAGNSIVPNSFLWSIANRVSYWMNLSGPSLTVDTACSSSLMAIYLACEAIQAGECSAAIVGGVNLDLHQAKLDINQNGGALSADGVCRSFGKGANGYVAGEGVGALFLKPMDQAVKDGDNIYGVIKSAVINHGGRTSGYTVPNPKAQTNLILSALERAHIDARSIGYIEAHGTGTELGDPIEITGLTNAFEADHVENQTCAIGSIKSNIGHLEAAAGVVSVSKVLLQMKHRQLVPSLHSGELNEFIDFRNSPFYVVQNLEEWKAKELDGIRLPLRAGISSFGAGGSNAHLIIESYEPPSRRAEQQTQRQRLIFRLSANTESQLSEAAHRLERFLERNSLNLSDVAYTLEIGRKSFDHRLAIIAATKEELLEKLSLFLSGKKTDDIASGHVKNAQSVTRLLNRRQRDEFIRMLSQDRDPHKLAQLWVEGLLGEGQSFQVDGLGKRVSLPTYPFADKRHWAADKSLTRHVQQFAAGMHPLIDSNESTFDRQLFKKTFHERDFFIYDHHVGNIATLPGVAYLELARKAGEAAAGRKVQKIQNIIWVSPITVQNSTPKEVFIELKPSGATVRFEVFSNDEKGNKIAHSQGTLLYATKEESTAEPEYIDLDAVRTRCTKVIEGNDAYPLFRSFGLNLGPSFQVLQEVYKGKNEILGALKLPKFRESDLESMVLPPSLVDGSLQAGMAGQLGDKAEEMFVPYSIGEVEILHPLRSNCFSYVTETKSDKKENKEKSRVLKTDVLIADETGKVLVKIRESMGVPLREVHEKSESGPAADGFSKLYYSYEWEKAPVAVDAQTQHSPASVVLFDTEETLRDLYQRRLTEAGVNFDRAILVQPGECFRELDKRSYRINPQNKNDFVRLFERLIENQCPVENICFAWARHANFENDETSVKGFTERSVYPFLFLCQSLINQKLENKVQLLYLHTAKNGDVQPHNEAMTGFVNTLHLEYPKLLCKTVEVRRETFTEAQILDAVWQEFQWATQDATAVRYQEQDRHIKKLKVFDLNAGISLSQGVSIREKGVYVITGGAGGLGLIFAQFLAKQYKAKLVLIGRSTLTPEGEAKLEELRSLGSEVCYVSADISNSESVRKVVLESTASFGEINGIIHAAGVLRDSLIRNKTSEEMSAVFAPKVYGTLHLDDLTKDRNLDFFVTFSSLAAVAGNAGQCDYSFANHFMDSFADKRELLRAKGERSGKTLSINWSLWADGGMKVDEQTALYFKKTLGISPLSAITGLEGFVHGLASPSSHFAILEGIREKVELAWGLRKRKQATAEFPAISKPTAIPAVGDEKERDFLAWLQNELSQIVAAFLKLDAGDVSPDKILLDLGFDSIGLTTFANAINEKYQTDVTPVLFFDYPSIGEIAKYLTVERDSEIRRFYTGSRHTATVATATQQYTKLADSDASQEATFAINKGWDPAAPEKQTVQLHTREEFSSDLRFVNMPIAIVGISGVMPQSEDLGEFWENLTRSNNMITTIPPDRWRWEDYYGDPLKEVNKSNSKWGGFMKEVDKFDPLFFGISPREAQAMDPQQRIFLETVWKAIEDSGQKVSDLSGSRTGLFVGAATNDYIDVMNKRQIALDGYTASGNSHSVLANRVSFLLNLRGPSAPIDTACSSSLVALHRAIESIHTGSCDMAIVGGVQVMLSPAAYISFGIAGMLSSDGKSRAFDKGANGYVRGEGCGAVFLKPLPAAEADGNHIYAVIKATAENHGGRVTTLTAPNSSAQSALLIEAYEKAQIDPATVSYIECHGIGSNIGDPIEVQALNKAFTELYKRRNKNLPETPHCGLSSVKPNIGHLETAAGISSLLKALLAIKYKQIPATIHFEEINPYVNLEGSPFYIVDKLTPWDAGTDENGSPVPRRVGVSSFGFGGANAHVVLEEYILRKRQSLPQEPGPQIIVLSAKNSDRLRAYLQSMQAFLQKDKPELIDLAYTLQVGRDEMQERLAFVVATMEELKQKLDSIIKGDDRPEDSYCHNVGTPESKLTAIESAERDNLAQTLVERKDLTELAKLWVSGAKVNWHLLHKSDSPKRIAAPTYPFAKQRCWIPEAKQRACEALKDLPLESFESDAAKAIDVGEARTTPTAEDAVFISQSTEPSDGDHVRRTIIHKLSEALLMDASIIDNDGPFAAYGVDSIIGVSLVRSINETLAIQVDPATLFEYSTVNQLTQYICSHWAGKGCSQLVLDNLGSSTDNAFFKVQAGRSQHFACISCDPIAVIGMSGRFANSESLDEFWKNLKRGKNAVLKNDPATSESVCEEKYAHGKLFGFIDQFDPELFGMSSQEAKCMDPQQRLFLEECWKALENAGYAGNGAQEKQCGVYAGCEYSHSDEYFAGSTPPQASRGNAASVVPARVAYHLNLQGPAIAVDTGCSSSLVAIHLACQGLWARETEMALAGGVCLQLVSKLPQATNGARLPSFASGEGVGVVVLKRLQDALEAGDYIHGVIAGSGVNQDGNANGLIAAKARVQERLERSVYDRFKIDPETLQMIEAHGSGNGLEDSIEFSAITRAIRKYTDKKQFCAIGTVKINVGQTGAASGIAGVIKILLSLKHDKIPPCPHFPKSNPAIDFGSSPFYVNTRLKEWKSENRQKRRAAVSSFGSSGTNAHLVIEEAPQIERPIVELPGYLITLSAQTPKQLKQQVANLIAFAKHAGELDLNDLSFSLFVGRRHFSHRLSCIVRDQEELIQLLDQWNTSGNARQVYTSDNQNGRIREYGAIKKFGNYCIQECKANLPAQNHLEYLATIADLYVQGYLLEYRSLFPLGSKRIPLPGYPLSRQHQRVNSRGTAKLRSTASDRTARPSTTSEFEVNVEHVLESILVQGTSITPNYERVTL